MGQIPLKVNFCAPFGWTLVLQSSHLSYSQHSVTWNHGVTVWIDSPQISPFMTWNQFTDAKWLNSSIGSHGLGLAEVQWRCLLASRPLKTDSGWKTNNNKPAFPVSKPNCIYRGVKWAFELQTSLLSAFRSWQRGVMRLMNAWLYTLYSLTKYTLTWFIFSRLIHADEKRTGSLCGQHGFV